MTESEAAVVLDSLAKGDDPQTHQPFPAHDILSRPDVIRALFLGVDALNRVALVRERRKDLPAGVGQPWDAQEETLLREEFNAGKNIAEMAKSHSRTEGGIRARLVRIGLLQDRTIDPRNRP